MKKNKIITWLLLILAVNSYAQQINISPIETFDSKYNFNTAHFSPDDQLILTACDDNTARLWNVQGKLIHTFRGHKNAVVDAVFSPNQAYVLTSSLDKTARLWDVNGELLYTFDGHGKAVNAASFSPDSQYIITASDDKTVKLWTINGTLFQTFKWHDEAVNSVCFSPDGKYILSASDDNTAKLMTKSGKLVEVFKQHDKAVNTAKFSDDGLQVITTAEDNTALLWGVDGKAMQVFRGHQGGVNGVAVVNGFLLTVSKDKSLKVWTNDGICVHTLKAHKGSVNAVEVAHNQRLAVTTSNDKTVKIWQVEKLLPAPKEELVLNNRLLKREQESIAFKTTSFIGGENTKIWAVIVGIGNYNHTQSLKYSKDDAYLMYSFLKSPEGGALPDEQIKILIDDNATQHNVLHTLKSMLSKAGPNDFVLFYFSGHGVQDAFLPIDWNPSTLDGRLTRLEHTEINDVFNSSKAKYKLLIADACHSGSYVQADATTKSANSSVDGILSSYYNALTKSKGGTAIMLSSKAEEISIEYRGLRQGVFSHYLLRGLKGEADNDKNKVVTLSELYGFIQLNVRDYTNNRQHPVIHGNYDPNMPIGTIR